MRFTEFPQEDKLNGLTVISLDRFVQHGYPKNNVEAEELRDEDEFDDEEFDDSVANDEDYLKHIFGDEYSDDDEVLDEADFGLGAGRRVASDSEMQDYLDRIRKKKKNKLDPYTMPYIHDKKIKIKDQDGQEYDLDALKTAIKKRPSSLLKKNEKMKHSNGTADQYYNVGLPALKGLAVNEETDEFVIVDTCPGAGACKTFCYAMKGSYIQYPDVFMKQTQTLNYLLNDPEGFAAQLADEITKAIAYWDKFSEKSKKGKTEEGPIDVKVAIRFHDSGDFFSPEYMRMAWAVARQFPDNLFYAYTKVASVANSDEKPDNFVLNFSAGALSTQSKLVNIKGAEARKHSQVVPKDMFSDLVAKEGGKLLKSASGATQIKNEAAWDILKERMAKHYAISKESILSYDEFIDKKMSDTLGDKPYWNVLVLPREGDISATDPTVIGTYLAFH